MRGVDTPGGQYAWTKMRAASARDIRYDMIMSMDILMIWYDWNEQPFFLCASLRLFSACLYCQLPSCATWRSRTLGILEYVYMTGKSKPPLGSLDIPVTGAD